MRKFLLLFVISIILCFTPVSASRELAAEYIKELLQIPAEASVSVTLLKETEGINRFVYTLPGEQITVTADDTDTVLTVEVSGETENKKPGLPSVGKLEAVTLAVQTVQTLASDIAEQLDVSKAAVTYSNSGRYSGYHVRFYRKCGEGVLPDNYVAFYMDSDTGRMLRYERIYDKDLSFARASVQIEQREAEEIFISRIGLEPKFHLCFDDNRQPKVFFAYTTRSADMISAYDGALLTPEMTGDYNYTAFSYRELPFALEQLEAESSSLAIGAAQRAVNRHLSSWSLSSPEVFLDGNGDLCIRYYRMEQGVIYRHNGVFFRYDGERFAECIAPWDSFVFPNVQERITQEKAESIFWNDIGLESSYLLDGKEVLAVYQTNSRVAPLIGGDGELLGYDGMPRDTANAVVYADLEDHPARREINVLSSINIYAGKGGYVYLFDPIPQEDYLLLLSHLPSEGMPIFDRYENITASDIAVIYSSFTASRYLDKEEIDNRRTVTKEEAYRYLIRVIGLREIGELSDIFAYHFADEELFTDGTGYAALARAMGLISSAETHFDPQYEMTYGDALLLVYSYLAMK